MKKGLLFVAFLLGTINAFAQTIPANMNLVPNGSFEFNNATFTGYDTSFTNNNYCWINAVGVTLEINGLPNVTSNTVCIQSGGAQRTGEVGISLTNNICHGYIVSQSRFIDTSCFKGTSNYPETKLLKPLVANTTYHITFYVGTNKRNGPDICNLYRAIPKNLGVLFTSNKVFEQSLATNSARKYPMGLTPQIRFLNWVPAQDSGYGYTKLTASYTAQGGEQFMTIGTFSWASEFLLE